MGNSRIDDIRTVDPVLTTIVQSYGNLSMVGEYLFPVVQVSKLKGKIPVFGKEAFVVRDTYRAMRAASNRMQPKDFTLIDFETLEHDIEMAVDYLESEESPGFLKYEQRIAKDLYDILLLGREKEIADFVQNSSNFSEGLKEVIESQDAWDDYSNDEVNPIEIIKDGMSSIRSRIARYPNTMVIGESAYRTLIEHPKIIERIKYAGLSKVTKDILSELLDIPSIYIGLPVFSNDGENFTDVWQDNIILAYVDKSEKSNRSEYNPSYGYTFQRIGMPEIDTYFENGNKIKVIRNTDNYCIKVTGADAGFLISNVNHN